MSMKRYLTTAMLGCFACQAVATQEGADADALAKALSNPVSALISAPFQLNYDEGYAAGEGERWTLNIQPVVPIGISDDWNLISRTITPLIAQDGVIGDGSQSGLGDIVQSVFFSPKEPTGSGWIWGAGPVFMLPTATDDVLGAEQWGIGPTAVTLKQTDSGWTYGALVNHIVSVAGDDARADVNATFLQPFVAKSLGNGRTANVNFESTYDWEASQWTIPLNVSYSKVAKLGMQRLSWQVGARAYLDAPDGGPDWGLRFVVTLLFPK
jgi:hypothetical protein